MASKDEQQTIGRYADWLNGVLNRTITDSRLSILTAEGEDTYQLTRLQNRVRSPLELRPSGWLLFRQTVRVGEKDTIIVVAASYQYYLDVPDLWLFRYDHELELSETKPRTHLHVNGTSHQGGDLKAIHFPTGGISAERVIAHLIMEHGIKAKCGQRKALKILSDSHARFVGRRTDTTDASLL